MKALLKHPFACFDLWSVGLQRLGGDLEFVTVEVLFGGFTIFQEDCVICPVFKKFCFVENVSLLRLLAWPGERRLSPQGQTCGHL